MANELNYVNTSYEDVRAQLIDRLKASDSWKDINESATGQMLLEFHAYVSDLLLYYIERRAEECYLNTAQNRSSIINLVKLLNYSPKRKISAMGSVQFSIDDAVLGRIIIPKYTEVATAGGTKFVTIADCTLEPGQILSNEITVIQGQRIQGDVISSGAANQEIAISDANIENNVNAIDFESFVVSVDSKPWSEVSSFLESAGTDTDYLLRGEYDDSVTIVFGDNIKGKIPESSYVIAYSYVRSDGNDGNVYDLARVNQITNSAIVYSYVDDDGISRTGTATVGVTNTTTITGGADEETTEEIRVEAPNVFKTGDRLVTKSDYAAFLYNYANVEEVNVWGENEETPPDYDHFNKVSICIIMDGWFLPTTSFKTSLSTALYEKSMLTVKYEYIDAEIINIVPKLDIWVNSKYGLTTTQSGVEAEIRAAFVLGSTAKLGEEKRLSNLIEAVDALPSIDYHHMALEVQETVALISGTTYGLTTTFTNIKSDSISIYIDNVLEASDLPRDDGSGIGDFITQTSNYSITGTVVYATGIIALDITGTVSSTVYIRYEQDNNGDIVIENGQICKLYAVNVDSLQYGS